MALDIRITSPVLPSVAGTVGGTIDVTNNGDGTYQLTSADPITTFKMDGNKDQITKIKVISEDLNNLDYMFDGCINMTSFEVTGPTVFGGSSSFSSAWKDCAKLISFPVIDISGSVTLHTSWWGCFSLTFFPHLDTSNITSFYGAWYKNEKLTSFPEIDTSSGSNFMFAWSNCIGLTSFPSIDTSSGTIFNSTWGQCKALTAFPMIDTAKGIDFASAWSELLLITSFPAINTAKGTSFNSTWMKCEGLTSFPLLNTSLVENFINAWMNCVALTAFPAIDTTNGTNFANTWLNCIKLTSFPLLNLSNGTNFNSAWYNNNNLLSFPEVDMSSGVTFYAAWHNNAAMVSFGPVDMSSCVNISNAWKQCYSLASFPAINTALVTDFSVSWGHCTSLTSFPEINTSKGTKFNAAWTSCTSLECMEKIDTRLAEDVSNMFYNTPRLCSPNLVEQAQITDVGSGGKNWEKTRICPVGLRIGPIGACSVMVGSVLTEGHIGSYHSWGIAPSGDLDVFDRHVTYDVSNIAQEFGTPYDYVNVINHYPLISNADDVVGSNNGTAIAIDWSEGCAKKINDGIGSCVDTYLFNVNRTFSFTIWAFNFTDIIADEDPGNTYPTTKLRSDAYLSYNVSAQRINLPLEIPPDDTWVFYTVTCSASAGYIKVYKDGVLVNEGQMTGAAQAPKRKLRLSANNDYGSAAGSKFGDFMIHSSELSVNDVSTIYNDQKGRYI